MANSLAQSFIHRSSRRRSPGQRVCDPQHVRYNQIIHIHHNRSPVTGGANVLASRACRNAGAFGVVIGFHNNSRQLVKFASKSAFESVFICVHLWLNFSPQLLLNTPFFFRVFCVFRGSASCFFCVSPRPSRLCVSPPSVVNNGLPFKTPTAPAPSPVCGTPDIDPENAAASTPPPAGT
jgi:hypothetical protein